MRVDRSLELADGYIKLPEATLLRYFGESGWELVAVRPDNDRMSWILKRPAK